MEKKSPSTKQETIKPTPLWSYETGGAVNPVVVSQGGEYVAAASLGEKVYFFRSVLPEVR